MLDFLLIAALAAQPVAAPGAVEEPSRAEWESGIARTILRGQIYPRQAIQEGISGTVRVGFVVDQDGVISDVRIHQSSGSAILDEGALATFRRITRVAKPPRVLHPKVKLILPVNFLLSE